jgi:hypothetical protein
MWFSHAVTCRSNELFNVCGGQDFMHSTRCTNWRRRKRLIICKTRKLREIICNAMENVSFSEHPSCHRRAITLHLAAYTSLRQVLDKYNCGAVAAVLCRGYWRVLWRWESCS